MNIDLCTIQDDVRYSETVIAMLNNCLPIGRNIKNIVKDADCSICPFCQLNSNDDQYHFFRCAFSLQFLLNEESKVDNAIIGFQNEVINKTQLRNKTLCKVITNKHLLWNHANQGACSTEVCISECDRIQVEINRSGGIEEKPKSINYEAINTAVAATHVITNKWEHITENIQGWRCDEVTPSFSLGFFEDNMILGKVTIFYSKVGRKHFKELAGIINNSRNRLKPTRIVLVNSPLKSKMLKCIYSNKDITLRMMENRASLLFHECDTTIIDRNYKNFTYFEKKTDIKIVNSTGAVRNISLSGKRQANRFFNAYSLVVKNITNKYKNFGIKEVIEELCQRKDLKLLRKVENVYQERKKWWNLLREKEG